MAILKYKKDGVWTELADSFPVDVPIAITEIDADLTTLNATANGTFSPSPHDAYSEVSVSVSMLPAVIRAGNTPVLINTTAAKASSSSALRATGVKLTIPKDGTYRFCWSSGEASGSRYTVTTQLYKNGSAVGTSHVSQAPEPLNDDVACEAGDVVELWLKGYSDGGTYGNIAGLIAAIDWDIWG